LKLTTYGNPFHHQKKKTPGGVRENNCENKDEKKQEIPGKERRIALKDLSTTNGGVYEFLKKEKEKEIGGTFKGVMGSVGPPGRRKRGVGGGRTARVKQTPGGGLELEGYRWSHADGGKKREKNTARKRSKLRA